MEREHWLPSIVEIKILDNNDKVPELIFTSFSTMIPEDSAPSTVMTLFKTQDPDSAEKERSHIWYRFRIESSTDNYYMLAIDGVLDWELTVGYNVTIMAIDKNKLPLSSSRNATLHVGDINNRPVFHQAAWWSTWPRIALPEPPLPKSAPQILTWDLTAVYFSPLWPVGVL